MKVSHIVSSQFNSQQWECDTMCPNLIAKGYRTTVLGEQGT